MTTAARSSTATEAKTRHRPRVDLANVGFAVAILAVVVFASVATNSFLTSRKSSASRANSSPTAS